MAKLMVIWLLVPKLLYTETCTMTGYIYFDLNTYLCPQCGTLLVFVLGLEDLALIENEHSYLSYPLFYSW